MNIKKFFQKTYFLIGLIIFIVFISRTNWSQLKQIITQADYYLVLPALVLVPIIALIKAWRWNYLNKKQGLCYKLRDAFWMYNVGLLLGVITPGNVGELAKAYYIKGHNSWGKALISVVIDRLADVIYLIIFGCVGSAIFFPKTLLTSSLTLIGTVIIIVVMIFVVSRKEQNIIKKIVTRILPIKTAEQIKNATNDFISGLKNISPGGYIVTFLLTILSWLIYYGQSYLFASSIHLIISPLTLAWAVTISGLMTILPIAFLGIGPREAVLMTVLSPALYSPEKIIVFSQLILIANLMSVALGAIGWRIKPLPINFTPKTINYE